MTKIYYLIAKFSEIILFPQSNSLSEFTVLYVQIPLGTGRNNDIMIITSRIHWDDSNDGSN